MGEMSDASPWCQQSCGWVSGGWDWLCCYGTGAGELVGAEDPTPMLGSQLPVQLCLHPAK